MLDDIPALEPSLSHKSSLLAKVRRHQVAKNLPDYIFAGLAAIGCSDKEIATLTRCNPDDLKDKAQPISEGKARLKHAIRKAQVKAALKGNPTMLVWLGKAILGQTDNPEPKLSQQTNIVVDANLLSSLQQSYKATLSDFRSSRAHLDSQGHHLVDHDSLSSSRPDNAPALSVLEYVPRSVGSDTPIQDTQDTTGESEVEREVAHEQRDEAQLIATQRVCDQEQGSVTPITQPHPPGVPPPTRTPTPTPKRATSLVSGNLKRKGKVTKWAQYSVGQTAERWSGTLKKLKGTRGGSRKEDSTQEGTA